MGKADQSKKISKKVHPLIKATPPHSIQRKAAISSGRCTDHSGKVVIVPIEGFDLGKTIFTTLEGKLPRMVIEAKIAKTVYWNDHSANQIDQAYRDAQADDPVPHIDPALIDFMANECDFSMEHADGTFLEHLLYCHEYSAKHFPEYSPTVMLLHSILGTGTNTFAMEAHKIPKLAEFLTDFELLHIEAFPAVLRLLADLELLKTLNAQLWKLDKLDTITFHKVIDNEKMTLSAQDLWIQLNYQLMHFADFLPAANWASHASDPLLQNLRDLSDFLDRSGLRMAKLDVNLPQPASPMVQPHGEKLSFGGRVSSVIPAFLKKKLAAKSIRKFSSRINHSLNFELTWK
ncbi:MAG: hypothetical protein VX834_02490 [Myxococcota bacterium]|nr:hypothetical protein [Myxococcota bacterium]